jgi:hypothetical protein
VLDGVVAAAVGRDHALARAHACTPASFRDPVCCQPAATGPRHHDGVEFTSTSRFDHFVNLLKHDLCIFDVFVHFSAQPPAGSSADLSKLAVASDHDLLERSGANGSADQNSANGILLLSLLA